MSMNSYKHTCNRHAYHHNYLITCYHNHSITNEGTRAQKQCGIVMVRFVPKGHGSTKICPAFVMHILCFLTVHPRRRLFWDRIFQRLFWDSLPALQRDIFIVIESCVRVTLVETLFYKIATFLKYNTGS